MGDVTPFRIAATDEELDDLKRRLAATRWPDPEPVDDWTQGIPLAYVQEVCDYWANEYDWRAREALLNRFDQFMTTIDGLDVHFVHVRSKHEDAMPLLITHGWPGSIVEFHKVIEPLTDPEAHGGSAADAFHVVAPSLPGYAFSSKPTETGWGVVRTAETWAKLMARLGYERYGSQGGDWGSMVTNAVGSVDPEHCMAIHVNMVIAGPTPEMMDDMTEFEQRALADMEHYNNLDSGYMKQQSTRPQTLGYGLVDSPAAQAAWILEKFHSWMDCDGHPENVLTRDELLDNVMLYWLSGAGASSARFYWETIQGAQFAGPASVPFGASIFPHEIFKASQRWVEAAYDDVRHFNIMDRGGHFAAFEVPDLWLDEIRTFFALFR